MARGTRGIEEAAPDLGGAEQGGHGFPQGESLDSVTAQIAQLLRGEATPSDDPRGAARSAPLPDPAARSDFGAQLEAALSGKSDDGGDADKPGDPGDGEPGELTLQQIAEKLGVKPEALYQMKLGMPDDGAELTLEQLKDLATEHRRGEAERLEWETAKTAERNRIANMTAELQTLVAMVPDNLRSPEMVKHAQAKLEAVRQQEAARLIQRVPEWKDPAQFAADMEAMGPHLSEWGFQPEELSQVYDHRLLAYVRHNALREQRLAKLLADVREKRQRNPAPRSGGREPTNQRAPTPARTSRNKVAAVEQILRGTK